MRPAAVLCLILPATTLIAATMPVSNSAGRDVSVTLFSTHAVSAVTLVPVGDHPWVSRCAACSHQPLTVPLHVAGSGEIFAGGTLRVGDDASGETRTATGLWHLRVSRQDHEVDVVLTLPSERYVAAVLSAEASPKEPEESLKALAILARTYALNGKHYTAKPGHLPSELCDSTECEAMRLGPVSASIEAAANATAGETLQFGPHYAEVFFSQSCGGFTEDAGVVWPNLRGVPYLQGHPDPYCVRLDRASWHAEVPLTALHQIAQEEGWHLPANIVAAHVTQRSASHRALRIAFSDTAGVPAAVSASSLRFGIGRALGWDRIRSDAYDLGVRNGALVFDGHGHGHGVGLCQQGATEMAAEGKSAREILAFYFPGTTVRIAASDHGWVETHAGTLTLRATQPVSTDRQASIEQTWKDARRLFPPRNSVAPLITFSPSTELFRQMTAQPGWMLASTRGQSIVLQPDAVLRSYGPNGNSTLEHFSCRCRPKTRDSTPLFPKKSGSAQCNPVHSDRRNALLHEMLHVLVESEAGQDSPLWLREGLVEVLAGEPLIETSTMPVRDIEAALDHPESLLASQRAHHAAAARVHALVARYGISAVRSWLSSGVPAAAA